MSQRRQPFPAETEPVPGENPPEPRRRPGGSRDAPETTPDSVVAPDGGLNTETDRPANDESDLLM